MIRNEDCRLFVVHLPVQLLFVVHGADIIGCVKGSEFNAAFGPYALNKYIEDKSVPAFTYMTFNSSTRLPPLQTEDITSASIDISSRGLFNIVSGWASDERRKHGAVLPNDLKLLFEPHTQSLRNAEKWTVEVLPHLLRGTPYESLPMGSGARYAIKAERESHMAATWAHMRAW